jgi:hypothetical protein
VLLEFEVEEQQTRRDVFPSTQKVRGVSISALGEYITQHLVVSCPVVGPANVSVIGFASLIQRFTFMEATSILT